jgi:hypothetical protein
VAGCRDEPRQGWPSPLLGGHGAPTSPGGNKYNKEQESIKSMRGKRYKYNKYPTVHKKGCKIKPTFFLLFVVSGASFINEKKLTNKDP